MCLREFHLGKPSFRSAARARSEQGEREVGGFSPLRRAPYSLAAVRHKATVRSPLRHTLSAGHSSIYNGTSPLIPDSIRPHRTRCAFPFAENRSFRKCGIITGTESPNTPGGSWQARSIFYAFAEPRSFMAPLIANVPGTGECARWTSTK